MCFKQVLWLFALVFGFLGVAACMVGLYAALSLGTRLERINDKTFAMVEKGLASAQDRVHKVQERVEESKITFAEFGQSVRDWSTKRAIEDLGTQPEIQRRAEKLAGYLQIADSWLDTSAESMRSVQQVLELGNSIGVSLDPASIEVVLEKITSLRSTLQQTERAIDEIREFTAKNEGESEENRLSGVTKLFGRLVATIGEIDSRLDDYATQLSELQTVARQWKTTTSGYILVTRIVCYGLLAWIAAGQAALGLWGWAKCCPRRDSA